MLSMIQIESSNDTIHLKSFKCFALYVFPPSFIEFINVHSFGASQWTHEIYFCNEIGGADSLSKWHIIFQAIQSQWWQNNSKYQILY